MSSKSRRARPIQPAESSPIDQKKWCLAIRHPDGPRSTVRLVLLALSTWANSDGTRMWPSIEKIAVAANVNRKTAGRALEEAAELGWVRRWPRGDGYQYQAAVPTEWLKTHQKLRAWERDPNYISERTRRGRTAADRVHAEDPDGVQPIVHAGDASGPGSHATLSGSGRLAVRAECPPTNPETSAGIITKTNDAAVNNINSGAGERGWFARMQRPLGTPVAVDPCDKVKRLVAMLADAKTTIDLKTDAVIPEVMRMCGLNSQDATLAVHRLRDEVIAAESSAADPARTS